MAINVWDYFSIAFHFSATDVIFFVLNRQQSKRTVTAPFGSKARRGTLSMNTCGGETKRNTAAQDESEKEQEEKDKKEKTIASLGVFASLSAKDIREVMCCMHFKAYENGQYIFKRGGPSDRFVVIVQGSARVVLPGECPRCCMWLRFRSFEISIKTIACSLLGLGTDTRNSCVFFVFVFLFLVTTIDPHRRSTHSSPPRGFLWRTWFVEREFDAFRGCDCGFKGGCFFILRVDNSLHFFITLDTNMTIHAWNIILGKSY